MGLLNSLSLFVKRLSQIRWFYLIRKNVVRVSQDSLLSIEKGSKIKSSSIILDNNSSLIIHRGAILDSITIYLNEATLEIGEHSFFIKENNYLRPAIIIDHGIMHVGNHSKLSPRRIWIRWGGELTIGNYTNINTHSEIRADEKIHIGSYCQISYNVIIWDTNTHCIYPKEKRKELAIKHFPYFGFEEEKPKTSPVFIGDNCWLGERSSILKGVILENNVIVGYNTSLSSCKVETNKTVVSELNNRILG